MRHHTTQHSAPIRRSATGPAVPEPGAAPAAEPADPVDPAATPILTARPWRG